MTQRRDHAWWGAALGMFAVGWGANQFVAMLVAYHRLQSLSTAAGDGLFGIYAVGLIGALLVGGPAADIWGRARLVRPAVAVSLLATLMLMLGRDSVGLLYAGRFVAGVASGAVFAAGSAWVKELSGPDFDPAAHPDAGARRAAIALSLGFGVGPLVAGALAQWAPDPLLTAYLPHLVIAVVALPLVWRVPETVRSTSPDGLLSRLRVPSAGHRRFRGVVVPAAPWVFGAPSVAFAVLPTLVSSRTGGYAIVFGGLAAGLTLGVGVAVQPLARRLDGPGDLRGVTAGLLMTATGMVVAAVAAATRAPAVALAAGVLLGAGYGLGLVSGLLETQRLAGPDDLAGLTAVFYALTYVGFAVPLLLAWCSAVAGYPTLLTALAVLALCCLLAVHTAARRPGSRVAS